MTSDLESIINDYKALNAPRYALLITGKWGSGKTFQTTSILRDKAHHLSLYGISSTADLHHALKKSANPKAAEREEGRLGRIEVIGLLIAMVTAISTYTSSKDPVLYWISMTIFTSLVMLAIWAIRCNEKYRNITLKHPIIFDDFERSNLNHKDLMGAINFYVEHEKHHVILIAHEDQIQRDESATENASTTYQIFKEKIIGQTIRITPNPEDAFDAFLNDIAQEHRAFLKEHKDIILRSFETSKTENLRILRYTMVDLSRLHKGISKTHKTFKTAMKHTIEGFCLITMHHRNRNTYYTDIHENTRQLNQSESQSDDEFIEKSNENDAVQEKFKTLVGFSFGSNYHSVLFTPTLEKAITEGIFNQSAIQEAFDQDSNFKAPDDMPIWEKAHIFETRITDEQRLQVIKGIDRIIEDRSESNLENVFELFFRKLNLKTYKIGDMSLDDIETCAKNYIDCIFKDTSYLEEFKQSGDFLYAWDSRFFSDQKCRYPKGTHGPHMTNIIDHARELFCKKTLSELPSLILGAIEKKDHDAFKRYASYDDFSNTSFTPFAHVDQCEFMNTLYNAEPDTQRFILGVFIHISLSDETKKWAGDMVTKLSAHIKNQGEYNDLQKIKHARLRVWIEEYNHRHPQTSHHTDKP